MLLNTVGGDIEAGLAIAEMISGMKKPTVSLVLGGGHSIGVPLAVAARKSFIVPSATMTVHPVRTGGLILADNVIWDGKVCMDPLPQDKQTLGIARFNDMVSADPRVESVILPLRDGLNIIRKK